MNQGTIDDVADIPDVATIANHHPPPGAVLTDYILPPGKVLVLKACRSGRRSNWNPRFQYPPPGGTVEAPDWDPWPDCGGGLHGWLWGTGSVRSTSSDWTFGSDDVTWLVLEVDADKVIDLKEKVKFPSAKVIFEGSVKDCTDLIARFAPLDSVIIGRHATSGDEGTAVAGEYGISTMGFHGTATAGDYGTSTTGDHGTSTTGAHGTSIAGDYGIATAGEYGTATAGLYGTSTAGHGGNATAGDLGTIMIKYWDAMFVRYRWAVGEVGIDGIEPNTPYTCVGGKLIKKVG